MGGERASTTRQREAGKICCSCSSPLPAPHTHRETYCARCKPPAKVVYASFETKQNAWDVVMFDSGTQRLIRRLRFQDSEKIWEMARRGKALGNLEAKQALEHGISNGKGGLFLKLTAEQYAELVKPKKR